MTSSTNTVKSRTSKKNPMHPRFDGYRAFCKTLITKGYTQQQCVEARHIVESHFAWNRDGITPSCISYDQWSEIVKNVWAWAK